MKNNLKKDIFEIKKIRNFSIIAHVDHGKSTLSDRLIQICGGLSNREMKNQVLDSMELERERGITIKSQSVTLFYKSFNKEIYQLNFIDTPGHTDFNYEVSRSLSACEGAVLLIDSVKGIEAQTLRHYYSAVEMKLKIIPVINKIDLPNSDINKVFYEIKKIFNTKTADIIYCSAKTGKGIFEILEKIIINIPPPKGNSNMPLQALIIDSWFDNYIGVVSLICIKNGFIQKKQKIKIMSNNKCYNVAQLGIFTPKKIEKDFLNCGEVGWLVCNIKNINDMPIGDTITCVNYSSNSLLPGFKKVNPKVFASLFQVNFSRNDYKIFKDSINKLSINDASLVYEEENFKFLGPGFRCGFLGLLHMDITKERLKREYNINVISTIPTVVYEILTTNNELFYIDKPYKLSEIKNILELREPIAECNIFLPKIYLGRIIELCYKKRALKVDANYYENNVLLKCHIPMEEIIFNFSDQLNSISNGYASLDYKFKYFSSSDIVPVHILINGEKIDPLTFISHKDNALCRGHKFIKKIKELIPRRQFNIVIQISIKNKIVYRLVIKQFRKNVLEKCHGGDISRKIKLLKKQKIGKNNMKVFGKLKLQREDLIKILSMNTHKK